MVKCVVQGCPNQSDLKGEFTTRPRKRFFSFPTDQARIKVWLAALRETDREPTELHQICEDHFLKDHITTEGISEDAIPLMPPYLDGPLGTSAWNSSDEQNELSDAAENEDEYEEVDSQVSDIQQTEDIPSPTFGTWKAKKDTSVYKKESPRFLHRTDVSLSRLTTSFIDLIRTAPDGVVDLNEASAKLGARKRRVYDVTSVLDGIDLIRKCSTNKIQWVGAFPASCFLGPNQKLQQELLDLKSVEEALDELIKDCAQRLFALTDLKQNSDAAYVTHEDLCRIGAFQQQTVIAIKAPEETKLEVPTPKEDGIQMHVKGCRGPISVLTCEMGGPWDPEGTGDSDHTQTGFLTLEESRISTSLLNPNVSTPQAAVQSA